MQAVGTTIVNSFLASLSKVIATNTWNTDACNEKLIDYYKSTAATLPEEDETSALCALAADLIRFRHHAGHTVVNHALRRAHESLSRLGARTLCKVANCMAITTSDEARTIFETAARSGDLKIWQNLDAWFDFTYMFDPPFVLTLIQDDYRKKIAMVMPVYSELFALMAARAGETQRSIDIYQEAIIEESNRYYPARYGLSAKPGLQNNLQRFLIEGAYAFALRGEMWAARRVIDLLKQAFSSSAVDGEAAAAALAITAITQYDSHYDVSDVLIKARDALCRSTGKWGQNAVCLAILRSGDLRGAVSLAEMIQHVDSRRRTLLQLAYEMVGARRYNEAFSALEYCTLDEVISFLSEASLLFDTEIRDRVVRESLRMAGWEWEGWAYVDSVIRDVSG